MGFVGTKWSHGQLVQDRDDVGRHGAMWDLDTGHAESMSITH